MSSLKNKLNRFKKHLKTDIEKRETSTDSNPEISLMEKIPFLEEWKKMNVKPFYFDGQYSMIREVSYPIHHQHGRYIFDELFDVANAWNESKINHPLSCSGISMNDMVFFDTETTGLGGGVGNTIFLIGYARVHPDKVVVTQQFLPSPGAEIPFYQAFLSDVGESIKLLSSYNGKAFDWPQVKTRHTLIRESVPKLPAFGHFDLLHASRRLWKKQLESVRLSNVEQEILNIERNGDVPGFLAPMLYFDFLKDPNPKGLQGIITHNEIDVLSLITLYIHLSKKLMNDKNINITSDEHYEIGRWYNQLGETNLALDHLEQAANTVKIHKNAQKEMALIFKKAKNYEEASRIWEDLLSKGDRDPSNAIELSKMYEHRLKDIEKALYYAEEGYAIWKTNRRMTENDNKEDVTPFIKRIDRLNRKLN